MSRRIILDGDPSVGRQQGDTYCPPVKAIASSNVTLNGVKIVLDGDPYTSHCNVVEHVIGSGSITINGKKIALDGDLMDKGDTATGTAPVSF